MFLQTVHVTEGIRLSCIQTDKFKTGILTLSLALPASKESAALASVLPGVLRRGTEKYPDMASINRRLDDLYASCIDIRCTKIGKNPILLFSAEMLDQAYVPDDLDLIDGVLDMLAQTLRYPNRSNGKFDTPLVEQEKRFELDALHSLINNTRAYASVRLQEMLFSRDPFYATLDERKSRIAEISSADLSKFYDEHIKKAPLDFFYVGSLSPHDVSQKIKLYFGDYIAAATLPIIPPAAEVPLPFRAKVETMSVSQGKLALGFRLNAVADGQSNLHYAALMFNEIFGGSPASKLFLNVREKMSLCYHCSSSFNQYVGILCVSAGIDPSNYAVARDAILNQLADIQNGLVSETEFGAAKVSLANAFRSAYDNPYDLQSFYGNRLFFNLNESIEDCLKRIENVTVKDVIAIAQETVLDSEFFVNGTGGNEAEKENDDE